MKYFEIVFPFKFKGAILVLLWHLMIFLYTDFLGEYIATLLYEWRVNSPILVRVALGIHYIMSPLFPLVGMIADVWTGRYRVIVVSIYCCFIGWIISTVSYFTVSVPTVSVIFLASGACFQLIGIAGFYANAIPFIIDQAMGASGDELTSLIYWQCISYPIGLWVLSAIKCLSNDWASIGSICLVLSGISTTAIMSTYYLCKQTLDTTPQISNPIKEIFQVLNYARKHKYAENRSAFTYCQDEIPSRIDLGKDKYGGPFLEEQVEDVKTVLRLLPLFVCLIGLAQSFEVVSYVKYLTGFVADLQGDVKHKYLQCFIDTKGVFNLSMFLGLLAFKTIIHPCLSKYIPSMLKRVAGTLFICLLGMLAYLLIDLTVSLKDTVQNDCWLNSTMVHAPTGVDYHWVLLPEVLGGVGFALGLGTMLELIVAQSPGHMRGLMVGMWYGVLGVGLFISFLLYIPFGHVNSSSLPLTCTFFYHMTKFVLLLVILMLFIVLARCYRLRVREEVVNIHHLISDVYGRYVDQAHKNRVRINEMSTEFKIESNDFHH